jgi:hypothetical protein
LNCQSKMDKQHGGKRKGAGRKPSPYISKPVKLHFESEGEYDLFMELTTPRDRVEIILKQVAS